jgi:hypothetical protein
MATGDDLITTTCDTCNEAITVKRRPYRAARQCEGCRSLYRLRAIEQAAREFYDVHFAQLGVEWRAGTPGARLRDALAMPEPEGDY